MIWLLLACTGADEGPWTEPAALTSTARLDGTPELSEAGFERRRYAAPPFAGSDADHSGGLSAEELVVLIRKRDPLTFDQAKPMGALSREAWSKPFSEPVLQRSMWELLAFLRAEVAAVSPEATLPDDATLQVAAATEDLYSEPVQAVLGQLEVLHQAHGLTFPDGLIPQK